MANKKRTESYSTKKLYRYRLNRKDILVIEKILRKYADVAEIQGGGYKGITSAKDIGLRHMPRKVVDMHVKVDGAEADSAKFLPKAIKRTRNLQVICKPGIKVTFTPLRTTIGSQENYATGIELLTMRKVTGEIEEYLQKRRTLLLNFIDLET